MIKYINILLISLIISGCATDLTHLGGKNLHERDSYNDVLQTLKNNNFRIISDTQLPAKVKEDEGVRGIIAEENPTPSGICTHLSLVIYPDNHKDRGLQFMESKKVKCS